MKMDRIWASALKAVVFFLVFQHGLWAGESKTTRSDLLDGLALEGEADQNSLRLSLAEVAKRLHLSLKRSLDGSLQEHWEEMEELVSARERLFSSKSPYCQLLGLYLSRAIDARLLFELGREDRTNTEEPDQGSKRTGVVNSRRDPFREFASKCADFDSLIEQYIKKPEGDVAKECQEKGITDKALINHLAASRFSVNSKRLISKIRQHDALQAQPISAHINDLVFINALLRRDQHCGSLFLIRLHRKESSLPWNKPKETATRTEAEASRRKLANDYAKEVPFLVAKGRTSTLEDLASTVTMLDGGPRKVGAYFDMLFIGFITDSRGLSEIVKSFAEKIHYRYGGFLPATETSDGE